jgi:hypothetical protein
VGRPTSFFNPLPEGASGHQRSGNGCLCGAMKRANALKRSSKKSKAVTEFLRGILARGAVGVPEIEEMAKAAGHLGKRQSITHSKPFQTAKKALGVLSIRAGFATAGRWCWHLPQATASSSQPSSADKRSTALRIPSAWLEGVAHLEHQRPPRDVPAHRWRQFLSDCHGFLKAELARRAAQLGWDAVSLFGCCRHGALLHPGRAGLLWAVGGGKLVELHRDWAVIETAGNGSRRVFGRRNLNPAKLILPWEGGVAPQ